jgi:hypothetical protein
MPRLITLFLILTVLRLPAQEILRLKSGGIITIQNGVELTLQGGITLEEGSGLANNGTIRLKNNTIDNLSNWTDLSSGGAMIGVGKVIFNSSNLHYFTGLTHFFRLQMNSAGITLNNHLNISDQLELVTGKINTGNYHSFLNNNSASSLVNSISNSGYVNSWINGNFRRLITTNTDTYDFPVGNESRNNLLQFFNNDISGTNYLTASFGLKPGTDAGLNVTESGVQYTAVNNGGVWLLVPDAAASGGNYALQLFFNGFNALTDNQFGILRRQGESDKAGDWIVPGGSLLESYNGLGRKVSDGYARRFNISDFSQWGIGMSPTIICENCIIACTYSQGFYGNINGMACYNNSGTLKSSTQLMLNAFGEATSKIFGNVVNRRFFTLYKTDITNNNIFKMLPGGGNSQPIAVDNILPYNGAYYSDQSTWYLVPIQPNGSQKGRINNQLLSQLITLWFNLQTSNTLASINLSNDTLVTVKQTRCGSGVASGDPAKFGLPHSVVAYLNGGNGYTNNINALYQLANDVIGGEITAVSPLDVQLAIAAINNAFDGCRILTGTLPYIQPALTTKQVTPKQVVNETILERMQVTAHPNPSTNSFKISIISNNTTDRIQMQVVDINGRVIETRNVSANSIVRFGDRYRPGTYLVRIIHGKDHREIKLVKLSD